MEVEAGEERAEGRVASWKIPLIFQSKLLCASLLYLATSLFLALNLTFSQIGCLFRLPFSLYPSHPGLPEEPLFSYPPGYGEQKHALPSYSTSASCNSSIPFPDYLEAFEAIERLIKNSSESPRFEYMRGEKDTFGGKFSFNGRKLYFNLDNVSGNGTARSLPEIPCGFFKDFPVRSSDRAAMERCRGVVVVSAIFNDHDKLRQPRGLGPKTLETVCFFFFVDGPTIDALISNGILHPRKSQKEQDKQEIEEEGLKIGVWRIIKLPSESLPYSNAAMNGVIPKHLLHRLFPKAKFSIWVDAKIQLTADPILLIQSLLVSRDADMAISMHPFNLHTMEEAVATARWRKWADIQELRDQMEAYCDNGLQPWSPSKLPYPTDVPDTAVIIRRHGLASDLFSCLLFNELDAFNPRDQLAFAYVRDLMQPKLRIHMFPVQIFEQITIEYRHNLKGGRTRVEEKRGSFLGLHGSKCEGYLRKMWGEESND